MCSVLYTDFEKHWNQDGKVEISTAFRGMRDKNNNVGGCGIMILKWVWDLLIVTGGMRDR